VIPSDGEDGRVVEDKSDPSQSRQGPRGARRPRLDRRERMTWVPQPWVEQRHLDVDPTYGVNLEAFTRKRRIAQVGKSLEEVGGWGPESPTRGRKPKS
jgi:hypothetical protein